MNKNKININIIVSGLTNTGKSTITYKIMNFLKSEGYTLNLESLDFNSEEEFIKCFKEKDLKSIEDRIKNETIINLIDKNGKI